MTDILERGVKLDINMDDETIAHAKHGFVYARLRLTSVEVFEDELAKNGDLDRAVSKAVLNDFIIDAIENYIAEMKQKKSDTYDMLESIEEGNDVPE